MGMPDISSLFEKISSFREQPVHDWHPEKTVDIDLEVDASGRWLYQGTGFQRHAIIKLLRVLVLRVALRGRHITDKGRVDVRKVLV